MGFFKAPSPLWNISKGIMHWVCTQSFLKNSHFLPPDRHTYVRKVIFSENFAHVLNNFQCHLPQERICNRKGSKINKFITLWMRSKKCPHIIRFSLLHSVTWQDANYFTQTCYSEILWIFNLFVNIVNIPSVANSYIQQFLCQTPRFWTIKKI